MEDVHLTYHQFHATSDAWTVDQLEAALHGEIQVYLDGKVHPMQLSRQELSVYEHAKQRHFVFEESASPMLEEAYYQYCVIMQICWVRIVFHPQGDDCRLNEEHTTVWYDLFRLRHALTPDAFRAVQQRFERARPGVYQEVGINLSATGGYGIVPEYASEKLAADLWQIFNTPHTHSAELFQ